MSKLLEKEKTIAFTKVTFEEKLSQQLRLTKISSPLFVSSDSGMQDNLNGIEKPIRFGVKDIQGKSFEIVHSLAKWKRAALKRYQVTPGEGIVTDMKALRPDEGNLQTGIHSVYVDQWDWEKVITKQDRQLSYLKSTVKAIYKAIKETELMVSKKFGMETFLPDEISFIHSEELVARYPDMTPKEREDAICLEKKAVFIIGIGGRLSDGKKHDGRAPDYDDWTTKTEDGFYGLNGDILVWNPVLKHAFEISSMGIRVDKDALLHQLKLTDSEDRLSLPWHQSLLNDELPLSVGGGIGQSRLVMLLLQKKHIGEVQVSMWPEEVVKGFCEIM